jgi:CheY-like chemotaxis protein
MSSVAHADVASAGGMQHEVLHSRILLVDDEAANVELLETLLTKEGFTQVLGTTQPSRCVDLVQAFQPDLLLLDLWMPDVDGFALLERLTRKPLEASLEAVQMRFMPIVVLTADATKRTRHRALGLGARDFLTKPFDPMEVLLRVWNLLETVQLFNRLRGHEQTHRAQDLGVSQRLGRSS